MRKPPVPNVVTPLPLGMPRSLLQPLGFTVPCVVAICIEGFQNEVLYRYPGSQHIIRGHILAYTGTEGQGGGSCPCIRRWGSRCPQLWGGTLGRQLPPRALQMWLPVGELGALHPSAALPPFCLGAMGCWCTHMDRSIPSCQSGFPWSHSWNLWPYKDLVRQPLGIRFDFRDIWGSSQKTVFSYCILEMKLVTFCILLLTKWLFAFYLYF